METKFETKTKEELSQLSEEDLKAYMKDMEEETARMEARIKDLRDQAEKDRIKTAELRGEVKVWKERNEELKKKTGMGEITDDELTWLMDGNYEKYWGKRYFKPDQWELKAKYAEVMGTKVDDSKYKGFEKMKVLSAWVDRKGTYHPVGEAQHDKWAWDYVLDHYGKKEGGKKIASTPGGSASEYLEAAGWVRIQSWKSEGLQFFLPEKMTHAQKQTVYKYCELHRVKLPFEDPLF